VCERERERERGERVGVSGSKKEHDEGECLRIWERREENIIPLSVNKNTDSKCIKNLG